MGTLFAFATLIPAIFLFYGIPREEPVWLLTTLAIWTSLMLLCFKAYKNSEPIKLKHLLIAAFLLRLVGLFAIPPWSDDFFRFLWDGDVLRSGVNPYLFKPIVINVKSIVEMNQLNSPEYFTVYPPLAQWLFASISALFPYDLIARLSTLRLAFILVDMSAVFLLFRILKGLKLPPNLIILYALNPLVVMELSGNLHLETFMVFGLLLSLYGVTYKRTLAIVLGLFIAIHFKVLPLILLPLFLFNQSLDFRKALLALCLAALLYLPFFWGNGALENWLNSISLYSQYFEFNGSLYKLFRAIGYLFFGYNLLGIIGPALQMIAGGCILFIAYRLRNIPAKVSFPICVCLSWMIYYLLSTTVHPWYLVCLIPFSLLIGLRSPILFAMLSMLSYIAYSFTPFKEPLWLALVIYLPIGLAIYLERKRIKNLFQPIDTSLA